MNNIYTKTFKKVFELLNKEFKTKFFLVQILIIITSIVDLLGLAAFIPIIAAISNEDMLNGDGYLAQAKIFLGFEDNYTFLLVLFLVALAFFFVRFLFIAGSFYYQNKFVFALSEYTGRKTYEYYLNSNYENFQKREAGKITRDLNSNSMIFSKNIVMPLLTISTEFISILMIVSGIIIYDFKIFLLLSSTIFPIAYLFNRLLKRKMKHYGERQNELSPLLFNSIVRSVHGYIDVKLRSKEKQLLQDYSEIFSEIRDLQAKSMLVNILPAKIIELTTVLGLVIIFVYGVYISNTPAMILPLIAVYAVAAYKISPSLSKIIPSLMNLEQYQYVFDVFSRTLVDNKIQYGNEKVKFKNNISLDNISFKYQNENQYLFENFNLKIEKGDVIGLKGVSGGGKTSLVKIISGFLIPQKGNILIDETPLSNKNLISWMNQISYVQQSPFLEKGSLTKNIAFLEENPDMERVNKAIQLASLEDLLKGKSPNDFHLSEDGKNLSGGQKQRVIIARAVYNKSNLIILDEATSALDNETEDKINDTILNLKEQGLTVIIIAHRLTTLKHCNRVFDIGKFVKKEVIL